MSEPNRPGRTDVHLLNTGSAWLRTVFDRHDLNRDGRLTLGEFIRLAKWLESTLTTEDCEADFARIDQSLRGAVDFEAFLQWWKDRSAKAAHRWRF
jgi:Ca2+-binding EF-hand superfamily protein